jgi:hypothetical protein
MAKIDVHYVSEMLSSIEDRIVSVVWNASNQTWQEFGTFEYNKTMMRVYDMRRVADRPIAWPVGDFTGLLLPDPLNEVQRGINPDFYGSTAFQLWGAGAGFQIASNFLAWSTRNPRNPENLCGAHLAYRWADEDNSVRPWLRRGRSARLRLTFDANLHHFHRTSDEEFSAYWVAALWLKDVTTKKYFQWTFFVWKNQLNSIKEGMGPDIGTTSELVATAFRPSQSYSRMLPNSTRTRTGPIDDRGILGCFGSEIAATHVEKVAMRYNKGSSGQQVSTAAADYAITLMTLGPEMLIPDRAPSDDHFCHFGSAVENVRLFTVYAA